MAAIATLRPAPASNPGMRGLPLLFALLCATPVLAVVPSSAAPATIPRLGAAIAIDGVLDEPAWQQAASIAVDNEIEPGDNIRGPATAILRIGYTSDALYLAFHVQVPDPARIRAHLTDRDAAGKDDFVGVMLDTFDDRRRNYEFFVNPLGIQMDFIRDEATDDEDDSWDGLWSSAGRITTQGYDVEVRIPFSTLRFRGGEGARHWGLIAFLNYPRDLRHQIANVVVPRGNSCLLCVAARVEGMAGVQQGRNVTLMPTLTTTDAQTRDAAGDDWRGAGTTIEPGLDLSWAPTPDLTLNATLNPDFSQVESDDAQLDLTSNFALLFPEKRPFFMEGADYFNTQFNVLYTRQIADPDFGLRVTGRTDHGAYGAFVARDAVTSLLVPGVMGSGFTEIDQPAQVAVARYRHDLDAHTSLGVIATARHGDGYHNDMAGFDGRWQNGRHRFSAQVLRSDAGYPLALGLEDPSPSGTAWRGEYNFDSRNWAFDLEHERVDYGFRADLGFIGQVGYDKSLLGGDHLWYFDGARINRVRLHSDFDTTHRYDGQLLEREFETKLTLDGPRQSSFGIHGLARKRLWNDVLFDESYINLFVDLVPRSGMDIGGSLRFGPQIDLTATRKGQGRYFDIYGNFRFGRGLSLDVDLFQQGLRRDGGTAFEATVLDTRFGWQFDPRQRLRIAVQASNIARNPALYATAVARRVRDVGAQLIYSYKINPSTALHAGGTLGGFLDDEHPTLFASSRGVFLKLSYGWQP